MSRVLWADYRDLVYRYRLMEWGDDRSRGRGASSSRAQGIPSVGYHGQRVKERSSRRAR